MRYIVVHLATTGKRSYNPSIVEIGAVVQDGSKEIDRFWMLSNPGEEALSHALPGALKTVGLDVGEVCAAPSASDVAAAFQAFLGRHPGVVIHAFNGSFSQELLAKEPWHVRMSLWGESLMEASLDALESSGEVRRVRPAVYPKLADVCSIFGFQYRPDMRALEKARAVVAVFDEISAIRFADDEELMMDAKEIATSDN